MSTSFCSAAGKGLQSCSRPGKSSAYCSQKSKELLSCRRKSNNDNGTTGATGSTGTVSYESYGTWYELEKEGYYILFDDKLDGYFLRVPDETIFFIENNDEIDYETDGYYDQTGINIGKIKESEKPINSSSSCCCSCNH